MERAIGQSVMSVRSERAFESSSFVFSRIETPEQTVRIYCVGKLGLDERLVRLPDLVLEENCKVVKLEKKIRVFRLPLRIGRAIKFVYVKQHNALSFWHRLTSLFCASAALRSLSGAATLLREGYATARPIAAVEHRRRGVLIRSFLSCRGSNGSKNDRRLLVRGPPFAKRHRRSLEKTGRVENIGTPVQIPSQKKNLPQRSQSIQYSRT